MNRRRPVYSMWCISCERRGERPPDGRRHHRRPASVLVSQSLSPRRRVCACASTLEVSDDPHVRRSRTGYALAATT
ncbi:hypothetical protein EVAR_96574_1 [Eumeta japonica]|uniref:Uncharacterized protein n=1 Tax=Eumeta variegata TaxID=151549 RepID=A0A4C1WQX0_EUMVA|nr:hypothetical protein EVAR_96574_1 [Eumeta japonica]